eukprot:GHVR01095492.1.p1 GENE.GHVR01095492.1~~GHVR01095492.1.p1  ORF type:complete len:367 (-),score=125.56 GHVR01095492.1:55-1155(-)
MLKEDDNNIDMNNNKNNVNTTKDNILDINIPYILSNNIYNNILEETNMLSVPWSLSEMISRVDILINKDIYISDKLANMVFDHYDDLIRVSGEIHRIEVQMGGLMDIIKNSRSRINSLESSLNIPNLTIVRSTLRSRRMKKCLSIIKELMMYSSLEVLGLQHLHSEMYFDAIAVFRDTHSAISSDPELKQFASLRGLLTRLECHMSTADECVCVRLKTLFTHQLTTINLQEYECILRTLSLNKESCVVVVDVMRLTADTFTIIAKDIIFNILRNSGVHLSGLRFGLRDMCCKVKHTHVCVCVCDILSIWWVCVLRMTCVCIYHQIKAHILHTHTHTHTLTQKLIYTHTIKMKIIIIIIIILIKICL